jgi:hypothetical protein
VAGYLLHDGTMYYLSPVDSLIDERALPLYFDEYSASTTLGEHYLMRLATCCRDGVCLYQPLDVPALTAITDVACDRQALRIVDGCVYADGAKTLAVYDLLGRLVGTWQGCRLAPGVYIVRTDRFTTRIAIPRE